VRGGGGGGGGGGNTQRCTGGWGLDGASRGEGGMESKTEQAGKAPAPEGEWRCLSE